MAYHSHIFSLLNIQICFHYMIYKVLHWFCVWFGFVFLTFFLYDIIWGLSDFQDFKLGIEEDPFIIVHDFIYCCIFSTTSLCITFGLYRSKWFQSLELRKGNPWVVSTITLVLNIVLAVFCEAIDISLYPQESEDDFWGTIYFFCVIASILSFVLSTKYYCDLIIKQKNTELAAKKKVIKMQLSPHFIFNSLSTLAALIPNNPTRAEEYTIKLSGMYRHLLKYMDNDWVSIPQAIDFTLSYLDMQKLRFPHCIDIEFNNEGIQEEDLIPTLSIQVLVENAIKHNKLQCTNPIIIRIWKEKNHLTIQNNISPRNNETKQDKESFGLGLKNLRERYTLEKREAPQFQITENTFTAILPIVHKTDK